MAYNTGGYSPMPPLTFTAFYGYPPSNPKCYGDCYTHLNEWSNRSREFEINLCLWPEGYIIEPTKFGVADIGVMVNRVLIVTWPDYINGTAGTAVLRMF